MKTIQRLLFILLVSFVSFSWVSAGFFDAFINSGTPSIRYCNNAGECGLQEGINIVKDWVNGIEKDKTTSEYVQSVITYLIWFISLIAVIYIIYAGFRILTSDGQDETIDKSKKTILYVMIGIAVIWISYPLTLFIFSVLNGS